MGGVAAGISLYATGAPIPHSHCLQGITPSKVHELMLDAKTAYPEVRPSSSFGCLLQSTLYQSWNDVSLTCGVLRGIRQVLGPVSRRADPVLHQVCHMLLKLCSAA